MAKKKKKKSNAMANKPISDKRFVMEKARSLPVNKCYVTKGWEGAGIANVIVTRLRKDGNLCVGVYLCDLWCLGVKDAFGIVKISEDDFKERFLDRSEKFQECDYVLAHNLIYGSEAFAADAGIEPCADFKLWRNILDEDTEDIPLMDIEFGDQGKYHLVARRGSREALYAQGLKERLGDNFEYTIGYEPGMFGDFADEYEDEYDDEEDIDNDDDFPFLSEFEEAIAGKSKEELLSIMTEGFKNTKKEDNRHPHEPYSYKHPAYPEKLEIKHKFIADEFQKPANSFFLPDEIIDRILALPKDEVISDISNIVMYTIGKTWKAIDEEILEWEEDGTILHSLIFLTHLRDEAGAEAVLEILRQDFAFTDFHLADIAEDILSNALYATCHNHPEILEEFLMTPGFDAFSKAYVSDALSCIAIEEPGRRDEIIEVYRRYLNFMQENMPTQHGCSGLVAGFVISDLINIKAKELLPEIKMLHDSEYVNLNICGAYESVEKEMNSDKERHLGFHFTNIKDFYADLKKTISHPF